MTGIDDGDWSEEAAVDRWLADLETETTLAEVVESRLADPRGTPGDTREEAYRKQARDWLDRGQPRVALSLLERSCDRSVVLPDSTPSPSPDRGGLRGQFDLFAAGQPGSAGLPALTQEELEALRSVEEPSEAMAILAGAARRLELHGAEARSLLRRFLERQRQD